MTQKQPTDTQFLLYQTPDGDVCIETRMQNETVWLTINQMTELFGVDKSGISRHLKNIFVSEELDKNSVVAIFATTASDGKTYQVEYYNLDAIISAGYRVNSIRGTKFRIWATQRLREFLIKGFAMDDERLKNSGNNSYFIVKQEEKCYLKESSVFLMNIAGNKLHNNLNLISGIYSLI